MVLKSPEEVRRGIAGRFRDWRLSRKLTQRDLAERSGMSLGSLKRFENSGQIALDSLLRLALALGYLEDFDRVGGEPPDFEGRTLDELLKAPRRRQRGRAK